MSNQNVSATKPSRFRWPELFVLAGMVIACIFFFSTAREESEASAMPFLITVVSTFGFAIYVWTRLSLPAILVITAGFAFVALGVLSQSGHSREFTNRYHCANELHQICLAVQNYHDTYGSLPPAFIADENGKPIHSWRVLILPFLENKALYDQYRFDEPWDGPNNRKLQTQITNVYRCPARRETQPAAETSYVVVMGPQTMWPYEKSTKFTDITDGTSNTIMVVEMLNSGIPWMEPRDLDMATMTSVLHAPNAACISSPHRGRAHVVFVDGHTHALTAGVPDTMATALLTIAGGEKLDPDE